MATYCGLDFGTSNSTLGVNLNNACQLIPLQNESPVIRSSIFADSETKKWLFGQEGISQYLEGSAGRLLMSLKSVLGSALMKDKTFVFNEWISFSEILSHFIKHIKNKAENFIGDSLEKVVLGRPVRFHDDDIKKDRLAQDTLEQIARMAGFKEIIFQYEPIAAALAYETTISNEKLALIIDIGGGTSDFTVIRLKPNRNIADRSSDVLANCGIHIAGTNFDQKLSLRTVMPLLGMGSLMHGSSSDIEVPNYYYHDLTSWHLLGKLYDPKTIAHLRFIEAVAKERHLIQRLIRVLDRQLGHQILNLIEISKQKLSFENEVKMSLDFVENNLSMDIERLFFNNVIEEQLAQILKTVSSTINLSQVKPDKINAIFYTGGSTKIPIVRQKINALFPQAEIVEGDAFGSVGLGLTIDAQRKWS